MAYIWSSLDMKETKFYQFMETLTPVQMNRLSRYLESPYFNKNEKLLKIYYSVETHLRDTPHSELEKTNIWDIIYPNERYNDEKFRKHCSQLMDLSDAWLAQEVYEQNPLHKSKYILEAVHARQLEKLYASATSSALLNISKQAHESASYYYYIYEIESMLYKLEKVEDKRASKKNITKINLPNIIKNLDVFYIAEKLKYYCTILNWQLFTAMKSKSLFIDEIVLTAQKVEYIEIPIIAIYLRIYFTYVDAENENHYYELKTLIKKYISLVPLEDSKNIIESAINYAIRRINIGDQKYIEELFNLYLTSLENEIIYNNDEISQWTFKNIVSNALRLKKYEWVEDFIKNYADKLNDKVRDNAVTFNLANLHFSKKNYSEVLRLLQKVQYEELFYNLNSKAILISSYFELDEFNVLSSYLDSFNIYLNRNKEVSKRQKLFYSNFNKFTKKLVSYQLKPKSVLLELRKDVENSDLAGKPWLLEKIDEQIMVAKPDPQIKKKKTNA